MDVQDEIDELKSSKSGDNGGLNSIAGDLETDIPGYWCYYCKNSSWNKAADLHSNSSEYSYTSNQ